MRIFLPLSLFPSVAAAEFIPSGSFGRPTIDVRCERWDLTMYPLSLFLIMRWIQGDRLPLTFELVTKFSNGLSYRTFISRQNLTFTNQSGYSISIAGNTLSWDDSQTWFNTTLQAHGLKMPLWLVNRDFSPYAGWIIGQLTEDLFTGIPMTRGISDGEIVLLDAELLNHMFSVKPAHRLVINHAIRAFRSNGTGFCGTFIYERSCAPNSSHSSFEPYTLYAGTSNRLFSVNRINSTTTQAHFAGCSHTDSVPFAWNFTLPDTDPVAEGGGGGQGSILSLPLPPNRTGILSTSKRGQVWYEALGAVMLESTPDLGGKHPPNPNAL
ncbi:hypothetical protein V8E55_008738 [Tylopilus felleus]